MRRIIVVMGLVILAGCSAEDKQFMQQYLLEKARQPATICYENNWIPGRKEIVCQ